MRHWRSRSKLVVSTLVVAVVMSACDPDDESRVTVRYLDSQRLGRNLLTVIVRDDDAVRPVPSGSLGSTSELGTAVSIATDGTLRVRFRFVDGQVVASEGEVAVGLQGGWEYGFTLSVDSLNPSRMCFGCKGANSFPLQAAYQRNARDSVWVVWGSNSIRHPVVY